MPEYDMVVIGSGPAGQKAAIAASKLGKRAVVVEKTEMVGGTCISQGTIPSKTLREAVLYLAGIRQREIYGASYRVKDKITMADLMLRTGVVIRNEIEVVRNQLQRNDVETVVGTASFIDAHRIMVTGQDTMRVLEADKVVVAVGTYPAHPPGIEFNGTTILNSDDLLKIKMLPKNLTVVGAGIIGTEYGTMFQVLGVRVTLIDGRTRPLDFLDHEIEDVLMYHMRDAGIIMRLGEKVSNIDATPEGRVRLHTESGKEMGADFVMFAAGRQGSTDGLNLAAAGLQADERGRLAVNENYQTAVENIYAAGDVIGFPMLASTSMEQGRMAASHAFGVATCHIAETLPFGVYTVPEISYVGPTEQKLTEQKVPFETGIARYRELARGQIIGDYRGMLKLIFHRETHKVLAVHILGEGATELVHIGQAVMALGGTMEYFRDAVFNYPTLAEGYKVAALNGLNKLSG
jgi:NAD(P) transhydrogenase